MQRISFLKAMASLTFVSQLKGLEALLKILPTTYPDDFKMPVFFVGHGDPNNAFKDNPFTKSLYKMGNSLSVKPTAILVISAHYLSLGNSQLKVKQHFDCNYYPVSGAIDYSSAVTQLSDAVLIDDATDLDHGAWAILLHIAPDKDVPVMELSLPMDQALDYHWKIAKSLRELRKRGVLIIGSGNIVHNLELSALKLLSFSMKPFLWATSFDNWIKQKIDERDFGSLIYYNQLNKDAIFAVNTGEHYLPMLYTLALDYPNEDIVYTYEEVFSGVSMRCFTIG